MIEVRQSAIFAKWLGDFTRTGDTIVILLCGGDKSSQSRDIALAKQLAKEI